MNRALISLALTLSLGTAFVAATCPRSAPLADRGLHFIEAGSPPIATTAMSIL